MTDNNYQEIIEQMRAQGILFQDDVTDEQLNQAEQRYGIVFPKELRCFYLAGMPVSAGFVRWLDESPQYVETVRQKIKAPVRGVLMAVEMEEVWPKSWGDQPDSEEDALEYASAQMKHTADLIPLYYHRYLVCMENEEVSAPVLSVYGGDIIYYGANLENWLRIEFCNLPYKTIFESNLPQIPGWNCLIG